MIHHGTIRKYTAALLDFFNNIEIQYDDSNGVTRSRNIPIKYSSREKIDILDDYTLDQLVTGNTNVLPKCHLTLTTLVKSDVRITNKNVKIAKLKTDDTYEYMFNSVPYEFTYDLLFMCRGMNEATQIIEQVAPKFNPTINIDIWDADNLDEPTRVPVKLLDIGFEQPEYDDFSANIVMVNMGLSIMGNLYPPIKSIEKIKDFKMYVNQQDGNFFSKKTILGWDVNDDGQTENPTVTHVEDSTTYAPNVISIQADGAVAVGPNNLTVIYDDKDNKLTELAFAWTILSGPATVVGDLDTAQLTVSGSGNVEVQVTITDVFGNYNSLSKTFVV